jgi:hypothetical protein
MDKFDNYNELAEKCMKVSEDCFGDAKNTLKEASIAIAFLVGAVKMSEALREDDGK